MKTKKQKELLYRKKNKFVNAYAKGIKLDARTSGCCYVTMKTNSGKLTVYIDSMDGLNDPPMVSAYINGKRTKEVFIK